MKHFNPSIIDLAPSYPEAVTFEAAFTAQTTQEIRAFRRQSKRDRYHVSF
jgi:hypothetical protein